MSRRRSVLSPLLSAQLSAVRTRPGYAPSDVELKDILAGFSALPANSIVDASREIVGAIGWHELSLLDQLFSKSERQLMKKNPDHAWLFLFHRSGYVREAALDAIDSPPASPFFVAALAWRLNDWVKPVRQAAVRCAHRVFPKTGPDIAAVSAPYLLGRGLVWARWREESKLLDTLFGRRDVMAAIAVGMQINATGPLASCLRHALRYPEIDEHLPRLATAAVQPSVRATAYQCLISGKARWLVGFEWVWEDKVYGLRRRIPKLETRDIKRDQPVVDFVAKGINDKSDFVRKVAADAMIAVRTQIPDDGVLVAHLAKDRSPVVRSRADFMLRHPPSRQTS
jgi:hypothetical protein